MSSLLHNKKNIVLRAVAFGVAVGLFALPLLSLAKAPRTKVAGLAKFVFKGTVVSVSANSLTLHVTSANKTAKVFVKKDQAIPVDAKIKLTKAGKIISLGQIVSGDTVKVFGIFNKKAGTITLVRWIKVLPK